jgi:excisionase family DNA binding protein
LVDELREDPAVVAELRELFGAAPAAYTPKTLAAQLEVTPRTIRAAIERGDLEARRSGRGYVIGADAVAAWTKDPARRERTARRTARRPANEALARLDSRGPTDMV